MTTYRTITGSLIVLPAGEPIFSEMSTHIGLSDEGAGAFVSVSQPSMTGGRVQFDGKEWPAIRAAIDKMLAVAQGIEAVPLPSASRNTPRSGVPRSGIGCNAELAGKPGME